VSDIERGLMLYVIGVRYDNVGWSGKGSARSWWYVCKGLYICMHDVCMCVCMEIVFSIVYNKPIPNSLMFSTGKCIFQYDMVL
jgi:hypothetical protein